MLLLAFYSVNGLRAQGLKPGFSPEEYLELMKVSARFAQDSLYRTKIPEPEFFEKIGFSIVGKKSLPMKVWSDCAKCSKQEDCDETAVELVLSS